MSDVRGALTRLEWLREACGGDVAAVRALSADDEVNKSPTDMGSYAKSQYRIACTMRRARENMAILAETGDSMDIARRAEISNSIRRDMGIVKKECTALNRVAMRENKREDYMQLLSYVDKTERIQRRLHSGSGTGDVPGVMGNGETRAAGTPSAMLDTNAFSFDLENRNGASFISSIEDEEFARFFEETKRRDAEIDQVLDRIGAGVTRLQENALTLRSELGLQQRLLEDTEERVDGIHAKLDSLNIRLRRTLEHVEKDRMSVYVLCCLLLLSIYGAIYTIST